MRITQSMAESISNQESNKKYNQLLDAAEKELRTEIDAEVRKLYTTKIPANLIEEGYIRTSIDVRINFNDDGERQKYFEMYSAHPCPVFSDRFEIDSTAKIKKLYDKFKKIESDQKKMRCDLKRIINSFTTHTALLVHLPELKPHFADADLAKSMAIVPVEQINAIRKQLAV